MARRFKGNTSISHPGIHVDYVSLAANCYTNKTKLILDMVEALKIGCYFCFIIRAELLGPVIAELRGRKHLWRRFWRVYRLKGFLRTIISYTSGEQLTMSRIKSVTIVFKCRGVLIGPNTVGAFVPMHRANPTQLFPSLLS